MSLTTSKHDIVYDLFVRTADENYITARWCAANDLKIDFLWLSVHALEKYLKAVLLLNGHSSLDAGHNIIRLYAAVKKIAGSLLPNLLERPQSLEPVSWRTLAAEAFIARLFRYGNADNRYLIYGYVMRGEYLFMLDQMVFAVRRLACVLADRWFPYEKQGSPDFTNREMLADDANYFGRYGMPLDQLIDASEDTSARRAALNLNFPFAPADFQHSAIDLGFSARNPVIVRRILDPLESGDPRRIAQGIELASWFLANIKVPTGTQTEPGVKEQIESAIAMARSNVCYK